MLNPTIPSNSVDAESKLSNSSQLANGIAQFGSLAIGFALLVLSNGRFTVPLAAWIAPIFLARIMRQSSVLRGSLTLYGAILVSFVIMWTGWIPVPTAIFYGMAVGIGLFQFLPYLLDRLLSNRLPAFAATFVLPTATVAINYMMSSFSPYGSWGDIAYSQAGGLELTQLLSFGGIHGLTFLMYWFAASIVGLWDDGFSWQQSKSQLMVLVGSLTLAIIGGGLRSNLGGAAADTVRIASVVTEQRDVYEAINATGFELDSDMATPATIEVILAAHHNDLFIRTEREAAAGAKIIAWAEGDGFVRQPEEAAFLARAAAVADRHDIYLFAAMVTFVPGEPLAENKVVAFDPDGIQVAEYFKSKIVPGDPNVVGNGEMALLDTSYGRIALAICFDLDFPSYARQAGQANADIIIAPSSDWKEIDPYHSMMASFRGVENGASVIRPTHRGRSLVSDPQGRVLAQVDHYQASLHTMVAEVPTQGVSTFYSWAGDWLAWLSALSLIGLMGIAYRRESRQK